MSSPPPAGRTAPGGTDDAPHAGTGRASGDASGGVLELDAPAKVNLYLRVLGRRPDGYHELVTVLQTVELCDTLRLRLRPRASDAVPGAPDVRLSVQPPARDVPTGPENLVLRAAHALLAEAGASGDLGGRGGLRDLGVDIELVKRIPAGGGLGGGSSDAATTLIGLNRLLGTPCTPAMLHRLAAALGSDVPFFLTGGTALCTGRGELVEPITPPAPFQLTLLVPPFGTPTPAVYAALGAGAVQACAARELDALRESIAQADEPRLHALFRNDLQAPAIVVQPSLRALLATPAHHLSGSGSTLFHFGHATTPTTGACRAMLICSRASGGNG